MDVKSLKPQGLLLSYPMSHAKFESWQQILSQKHAPETLNPQAGSGTGTVFIVFGAMSGATPLKLHVGLESVACTTGSADFTVA